MAPASDRPAPEPAPVAVPALRFETLVERLGLRDLTLVAHDFGGPIALPYALKRPDNVRRLVHVNPWMSSNEGDRRTETAGRQAPWVLARELTGSNGWYANLWSERDALRSIPLLILWGVRDRLIPHTALERWVQAFPHARIERLEASGHFVPEEAPEALARLQAFLEAAGAAPAGTDGSLGGRRAAPRLMGP